MLFLWMEKRLPRFMAGNSRKHELVSLVIRTLVRLHSISHLGHVINFWNIISKKKTLFVSHDTQDYFLKKINVKLKKKRFLTYLK